MTEILKAIRYALPSPKSRLMPLTSCVLENGFVI